MKKRISWILAAALFSCHAAQAGNIYLGPEVFVQANTTPSSNYRGLFPRLSVGYAQLFDKDFYLALEAFGVPTMATLADNHNNGAVSARSTRSIGASIIPGGMLTENVLAFARVGVLNTQFTAPNSARWGGQIGVGLQTSLTPYWDLRAEYIYSAYKTVPTLGAVKSDQMGVGLIYKVIG